METKIEINENSIFVNGVEYIKKQKQPTPKDGEVWCVADEEISEKWIFIKRDNNCLAGCYVAFTISDSYIDVDCIEKARVIEDDEIKLLRHATPEEAALLHAKLAENGKVWNAEKKCLEDIPKPLKEGDLAIGWDEDKEDAFIGIYNGAKKQGRYEHEVAAIPVINAIPFESIEQYKGFITVHKS